MHGVATTSHAFCCCINKHWLVFFTIKLVNFQGPTMGRDKLVTTRAPKLATLLPSMYGLYGLVNSKLMKVVVFRSVFAVVRERQQNTSSYFKLCGLCWWMSVQVHSFQCLRNGTRWVMETTVHFKTKNRGELELVLRICMTARSLRN